jgi:hypothetical protein
MTKRRDGELYSKGGISGVTEIKGVYYNIDYRIGLINKTLDFATSLKNYSSFIGRFLLKNSFNSIREIYINLIYLKYK